MLIGHRHSSSSSQTSERTNKSQRRENVQAATLRQETSQEGEQSALRVSGTPHPIAPSAQDQSTEQVDEQDQSKIPLDPKILEVMGERFLQERQLAQAIPNDLSVRWEEILKAGLPSETRVTLVKKYPPPKNCVMMDPPRLNAEIRASLQETVIKRDDRIVERQTRIAACLAAVGKTFLTILDEYKGQDNLTIIELLSDIGKFLTDLQHDESAIRKSLILANLNTTFRDVLNTSTPDEFLFGKQLEESLKAAKALETSRKELKTVQKSQNSKNPKNSKFPSGRQSFSQRQYYSTAGGKKQQNTKNQGYQNNQGGNQRSENSWKGNSKSNWKTNQKQETNPYQKRR